jgi:hypothetical protein
VVIALLFKVFFFFAFFGYLNVESGLLGLTGGDTVGYLSPIESLIKTGSYSPDFRMPGYGGIYFLFRLFFSSTAALNSMIISQWILVAVSCYLLARAAYNFTDSRNLFYSVFLLYAISVVTLPWDFRLVTESYTVSALIIFTYLFSAFLKNRKFHFLFFAGVFYTWIVFLHPTYLLIILIPLFLIFHFVLQKEWGIRYALKSLFLISAIFIVIEGAWVIRNYKLHNRFAPLTNGFYLPELEESYLNELMSFVIAWGGDRTWWEKNAEISWFTSSGENLNASPIEFPEYIYTSAFNQDSLQAVRSTIQIIEGVEVSNDQKNKLTSQLKVKLKQYTQSIQKEKPILYYVGSRAILFKKFLLHSGTQVLFPVSFNELSVGEKMVKIMYTIFYLAVMILGTISGIFVVILFFTHKKTAILFFALAGLYPIFIYPILGHIEARYIVPAYPFMLVCALYGIHKTISTFKSPLKK